MSKVEPVQGPSWKDRLRFGEEVGLSDHLVGAGFGAVYVAWLLSTARSLGFARDEGFYFRAATEYARWFRLLFDRPRQAFEQSAIDSVWQTNSEHPALMKSLFALSWMFFHEKWKIFEDASTAFRFPGMVMGGIALWLVYIWASRVYTRRAGVFAAFGLALMPRVFYHAHLACFDVGVMTMWTACIYVYWRAEQKGGLGWAVFAGVMYGLTLETKHNAWFLPGVFLVHAFVLHGRRIGRTARTGRIPVPASLLAMATIGPALFVLLWPWLWNDTLARVQGWFRFHLNHEYYNMEFLHVNYWKAPSPRGYMPVMIAATVPAVTLLLFFVGLGERGKIALQRVRGALAHVPFLASQLKISKGDGPKDRYETDLLLFLGLAVPLALFLLPATPIFGGTKHWFPAYPFLVIFAGRGFDLVCGRMERALAARLPDARMRLYATGAMLAAVVLGPLVVTSHSHPFGLSSYVPLVGGTAGGADLGLNRQFWGFTTQSLADYFDKNAPRGASVFIHDTAWDSWARMLDEHRLRPDLRGVGSISEADFAIVHHELHMAETDFNAWVAYGHVAPDFVLTHDGVPIVSVYRRSK
jgi:4-amino-4-deoxy-L-arabinose transferase-like glycosyltransferase